MLVDPDHIEVTFYKVFAFLLVGIIIVGVLLFLL